LRGCSSAAVGEHGAGFYVGLGIFVAAFSFFWVLVFDLALVLRRGTGFIRLFHRSDLDSLGSWKVYHGVIGSFGVATFPGSDPVTPPGQGVRYPKPPSHCQGRWFVDLNSPTLN
jgi:hypothetical protein